MQPKMFLGDAAKHLNVSLSALSQKIKNNNLTHKKHGKFGYFEYATAKKIFNINFSPKKITVHSCKGGVGKTTISYNLAHRLNLFGAKVLVVDLDYQANLTQEFGHSYSDDIPVFYDVVEGSVPITDCIENVTDGLDLLPSNENNAKLLNLVIAKNYPLDRLISRHLKLIDSQYDIIIIDCHPNIGPTESAAVLYSDLVLVPVNPTKFNFRSLDLIRNQFYNLEATFEKTPKFRVLVNRAVKPKKIGKRSSDKEEQDEEEMNLTRSVISQLSSHPFFGDYLLKSTLRFRQAYENESAKNVSIFNSYSESKQTLLNPGPKEEMDSLIIELFSLKSQLKPNRRVSSTTNSTPEITL